MNPEKCRGSAPGKIAGESDTSAGDMNVSQLRALCAVVQQTLQIQKFPDHAMALLQEHSEAAGVARLSRGGAVGSCRGSFGEASWVAYQFGGCVMRARGLPHLIHAAEVR